MKRSLILLLTIAAATAGAALSGCGATSGGGGGDALAKAAATTSTSGGARMTMTMTMSSAALPRQIHMTANGVMDQVRRQGRIQLDMSDIARAAGGSTFEPSQLQATEILNGTVIYMRLPLLDGKLPDNKRWLKLDLAKAGKALGIDLGQVMQPGQDPTQQLDYLRAVSNAKKVGSDTIRGVKTTHYHGVSRLDRYPQLLPPRQRAAARATVQRLIKLTGTRSMPIDAWVDGANKIRRIAFVMNMREPQLPQSLRMNMQEDLYDFGTPVDATPPPSDQVYDATKAASSAIRSRGLGG